MSAEKFGLWRIICADSKIGSKSNKDHSDRFQGGKVKFDQEIRIFNIRYQKYLSVRKKKVGRNKFEFFLATEEGEEENTIFKISNFSANSVNATT